MQKIIGIVTTNSIAYLKALFSKLAEKNIVVSLNQYRIKATRITQVLKPYVNTDEVASIAFTSGTQNPKGVKMTHNNLAEVVQCYTIILVDSSISKYICIPIYHSFSLRGSI